MRAKPTQGIPASERSHAKDATKESARQPARGVDYAFARWRELLADDAPWWARSSGMGIRMRLVELSDVSAAFEKGGVASEAMDALRREAVSELIHSDGYCAKHFPEIVKELRTLEERKTESLLPRGHAMAGARAALIHFETTDPLISIATELGQLMAAAHGPAELSAVSASVELLDAELAFQRHAVAWRRRLVDRAEERQQGGESCSEALIGAMHDLRVATSVRQFDVVLPLNEATPGKATAWLQPQTAEDLSTIVQTWSDPRVLDSWPENCDMGQRYPNQPAADAYAAADLAAQEFRRDAGLWRLLDGKIEWRGRVMVDDPAGGESLVIEMPLEQLPLAPPAIEDYRTGRRAHLDDAVIQLAQARIAAPATALADLWSAAEAAFGGVLKDPSHEVARDLANLASALYPYDLLSWLSARCTAQNLELELPGESPVTRLTATLMVPDGRKRLQDGLATADPLAWHRLRGVLGWGRDGGLDHDVAAVRQRLHQVANRAYLMRNFAVHRGEWRMRALAATLPIFADLVRTCIGHVMADTQDEDPGFPLVVARGAAMTVLRVVEQMKADPADPRPILMPLLRRP